MTTIDIARIEQPAAGKKMGKVFTDRGEELHIWPDKLVGLEAGGQAEVDIVEGDFNGRPFKKIVKVKRTNAAKPQASPPAHANGHADAEGQFVREMLLVGLRSGAVTFSEGNIRLAIVMLRKLWREISGGT